MRRILILISLLTVLMVVFVSPTFGDVVAVGSPYVTNSWGQRFNESGVGSFDFVALQLVQNGPFETPAMRNFSVASWALTYDTPSLALASGVALTSLDFDIVFEGSKSTSLVFNFFAFWGDSLLEALRVSWSGSGWSYASISANLPTRSGLEQQAASAVPTPEPVSLLLLSLGCVVAEAARRFKA